MNALLASGDVPTQTRLAKIAGVTPARVTQILRLLDLSAAIQRRVLCGEVAIPEPTLLMIAAAPDWREQSVIQPVFVA